MNIKNLRILILFLTYGDTYKGSLEAFIDEYCLPLKFQKRLIVIENADENMPVRQRNDWIYEIGGDNSVFEFSGWQKAIESEPAQNFKPDVYLFANSSMHSKLFHERPILNDKIISYIYNHNLFAGNIRKFTFPVMYKGLDLSTFITTQLFIIPKVLLKELKNIVSEYRSEDFIKPTYSPDLFTGNVIWTELFRKTIKIALTDKYRHKKVELSPENHAFFKRKTLCIINEFMLSGRTKKLNYQMVDITPFVNFCNSFFTIYLFDKRIRPFQFIKKIILTSLNTFSKSIGLGDWFSKLCSTRA